LIPNIGFPELILILVIIVVILGPGRLPELGKAIGKMVRAYRKEANDGLPPPVSRRERRRLERERAKPHPVSETTAGAAPPPGAEPAVKDPGRRGLFTAVFKVFQLLFKIWRWKRRLP
jgi:TatA/E family protein of Tat protein translocase